MPPERLPFADDEFDLVAATEVLEHVPDPEQTVCARWPAWPGGTCWCRCPREPLWRALNVARGAYLRDLGNTPGHLNHWSKARLRRAAGAPRRGRGDPLAVPLDDAAGPRRLRCRPRDGRAPARRPAVRTSRGRARRRQSYASGARILSIGIASTGIFTFAYLATASHVLDQQAYGRDLAVLGDHVRDPVGDLPADRAAALAHDRRPPGARACSGHPLRMPARSSRASRSLFLAVALACGPQIENDVFDGSSGLYWILVVGVIAYAASYFARGWLAGHQRFALYGGLVFLESTSRFLFALAVAVGIGSGSGGGRARAWRWRRSCRCA